MKLGAAPADKVSLLLTHNPDNMKELDEIPGFVVMQTRIRGWPVAGRSIV